MSDSPVPGWYPDAERPGGERWWDGQSWTEYRREAGGQQEQPGQVSDPVQMGQPGQPGQFDPTPMGQPGAAPGQPGADAGGPVWGQQQPAPAGYQPYANAQQWPSSSKAGWALGLSIVGLLCCGLSAIAGVIMGRQEMTAIDQGRANPANRGLAQAAFIVGIIALALAAVWIALFIIGAAAGSTT